MDEMDKTFRFFVPLELQKSEEDPEGWFVRGVISTKTKDFDGETVVQKGLDFDTYFRDNGFIKYEHRHDTPENIIGVPFNPEVSDNETRIKGVLFKSVRMAKKVYELAKSLEEHNLKHPTNQRQLGWSIEGKYLNRDPKTGMVEKALVTNVVITPNPKNTDTYLELCKSLKAGYGTSPETQTGGGALRKESLEGSPKEELPSTKEKTQFDNYDDAYAHFTAQGLSHEEASKKAKKSLKQEAKKAMDEKEFEALKGEVTELKDMMKSLTESKTVAPGGGSDEEFIDGTELVRDISEKLETITKSLGETREGYDNALKEIAKGLGSVGEHISTIAETQENLNQEFSELKKAQEETDKLVKAIARQDGGVAFSNLAEERIGEDVAEGTLTKSQVTEILTDMALEGKLPGPVVTSFELNGWLPDEVKKSVWAQAKQTGVLPS